jgi:hypothetical protein
MLRARLERYHGQDYFVSAMQELGYKTSKGMCAGLAQMAIQAFLVDELDTFNERIVYIHDTWKKIAALKQDKSITNLAANSDYQRLMGNLRRIDCLAFFDGIELYQKPDENTEFLGRHLSQYKPAEISITARSRKLSAKGGLYQLEHFLTYYTAEELAGFFSLLEKHAGNEKIAMSFSSNNHRISVCYNGRTKKWILIDANQLPAHEVALKDLTERVFAAYTFNGEAFDSTAISTRIYSTGNSRSNVNQMLSALKSDPEFQNLLTITPSKASHRTKDKSSLLHLAARYGHAESADTILDIIEFNPNDKKDSEETPLFIAAYHGHFDTAKRLLENDSTQVDLANDEMETPLYVAAKNGDKKMVELLLRHYSDPHLTSKAKSSAVTIAAEKGHLHILKLFSHYEVNLFKSDAAGKTPLDYAREHRHQDSINFLEQELRLAYKDKPATTAPLRKHSLFASSMSHERKPDLQSQNARKRQKTSRQ